MAVNFPSVVPEQLHPVAGVTLGWAEANIRKPNRKDVLVISVDEGATVAGVFTSKATMKFSMKRSFGRTIEAPSLNWRSCPW